LFKEESRFIHIQIKHFLREGNGASTIPFNIYFIQIIRDNLNGNKNIK